MKKFLQCSMIFLTLLIGTGLKGNANAHNTAGYFSVPEHQDIFNTADTCDLRIFVNKTDVGAAANAGASVSVEGGTPPYSYYWTTGDTSNAISDITAGRYYIVVVDARGCRAWAFVDINNLDGPQILVSNIKSVSCHGEKDGAIEIEIIEGTPPYLVRWNNGERGTSIEGLESAFYDVGVVDAQGLKSFKKIFVPQPQPLNYEAEISPPNCEESDGSMILSATGGTPPYTYTWIKGGEQGPELLDKPAGAYPLLIEDANGCQVEKIVNLSDIQGPELIMDTVKAATCQENDGAVEVAVDNPTGLNFEWTDLQQNIVSNASSAADLPEGTYMLMISDEFNCKTAHSVKVELKRPEQEPICVATIDTATNNNIIIWEREVNAAQYNIYRETGENNDFLLVGTVPYDALNYFEDTVIDPNERGYAYKITSIDECGTESVLSEMHKLCHLSVVPLDRSSLLVWDAYIGFHGDYQIQRRIDGGKWEDLGEVTWRERSFNDETLPADQEAEYRVRIPIGEPCEIKDPFKKVGSGSYSYTLSNIEDNRASATDINKLFAEKLFRIYPNPSAGYLRLVMDLPVDEDVQLGVYDLAGRTVLKRPINPSEFHMLELDLSQQPTGIYVIHAVGRSFNFRKKIIIR